MITQPINYAAQASLNIAFDEEWYLREYRDVAEAVRSGRLASALQHYLLFGFAEGRLPLPPNGAVAPAAEIGAAPAAEPAAPPPAAPLEPAVEPDPVAAMPLIADRVRPVSGCRSVSCTPGKTDRDVSSTRPVSVAVV